MRILFMGTPDIAAECLKALYAAGHDICAVYTRRDKPVGRKQVLTAPPVKEVALAHGTPVFQPRTLRDGSEDENIRALAPELIVVVAYGCILPKSVLEMPRYGCINLHVSLLPKYRGSAPVQWSVLNGDAETGVSIMQMDEGLDTGDVLYCKKIVIDPEETSGELFDRVTAVGAEALCETIPQIAAGTLTAVPQQHENATLAPMLNKEMAEFHLTDTAAHIHNWVRGMNPWPGAWFITSGGKKLKVMSCRVAAANGEAPGTVLATKPLTVACGEGAIQLLEVVPEGKKPMDGTAFAAGLRLKTRRSLIFLLLSIVLWFFGYNAVTSKYSVYASNILHKDYNLTLMLAQAAAIVAYLPVGIVASKIGRKKTILGGVVMLAIAFGVAAFLNSESPTMLMNAMFCLAGIGWATINVNSFPMVVEMCSGSDVGRYTGFYYTASMAAQVITPMFSGFLMDKVGMTVLFPYAAIFVAGAFVTMLFVRHGDSRPIAAKGLEALDMDD